jgi:hypothetical protein
MHMGLVAAYPNQSVEIKKEIQKDETHVIQQTKSNEIESSIASKDTKDTAIKKPKAQIKSKNSKAAGGWDDAFRSTGLMSNKNKKPTGFSVFKFDALPTSGYKKESTIREEDILSSLDLSKLKPAGKFADNEEPAPVKAKNTTSAKVQTGINLLTSNEVISINTPNTPKAVSSAVVSPRATIQIMPPAPPPGFDKFAPPPGFDKFPLKEGAPPPGFDVFPVGVIPPTASSLSRPSSAVAKPSIPKDNDKNKEVEKKPIIRSGEGWVHIGGTSQSRQPSNPKPNTNNDPDFPSLPVQEKVNLKAENISEKVSTIKQSENSKPLRKNTNNQKKSSDDLKSLAFVKSKK